MASNCCSSRCSRGGIRNRIDCVLKDDLLRRVLELLIGQPAAMRHGPVPTGLEDAPMPQQKRQQLLPFPAEVLGGGFASADQIAHGFVGGIRHPHRGQFAGPQ
jgi:hypothetical protein